jgi:hypothetical protein
MILLSTPLFSRWSIPLIGVYAAYTIIYNLKIQVLNVPFNLTVKSTISSKFRSCSELVNIYLKQCFHASYETNQLRM